ncbi:hypothetical protein N7462_004065 [Penicillium macrosclerotiorum]|uniref:uncharacterized protein n=1 Tax=Penicillium macrosclerotiorum TaxID=303699 RepID=UPI0025477386|nr:uncharacterized protein N7462_004065 [Penicillium macrosclerotiorum]KAJ5689673.1 hypothetical protein N7462_004065 [Penicillium macrosclerotiorum]
MCLPGLCDLDDCFGGSGTAAPQMRQRPAQQYPYGQQRAGVPAAARAPRPTQREAVKWAPEPVRTQCLGSVSGFLVDGNGGKMQFRHCTAYKAPQGSIIIYGVPKPATIVSGQQGQSVDGCFIGSTNRKVTFRNAEFFRTQRGTIILRGAPLPRLQVY